MYLNDIIMILVNFVGVFGILILSGLVDEDGFFVGI